MSTCQPLRLVFAGTPEFAATHLRALVVAGHNLVAVYTQPDRRAGRGKKLMASPVKTVALEHAIPVKQPPSLKAEGQREELDLLKADVVVVVAYGLILPQPILDTPRLGCINVHASLLPRWRGAAPIQRAIEAGDRHTGISIMKMDAGLDTGPVLATMSTEIDGNTTSGALQDSLAALGPGLLLEVLNDLEGHLATATIQSEGATYAHKIERADGELDWQLDAAELQQKVRAFNPVPGAWSLLAGTPIKIWQAQVCAGEGPAGEILQAEKAGIVVACGHGALSLQTLQLAGGKALSTVDILNSRRDQFLPGTQWGH